MHETQLQKRKKKIYHLTYTKLILLHIVIILILSVMTRWRKNHGLQGCIERGLELRRVTWGNEQANKLDTSSCSSNSFKDFSAMLRVSPSELSFAKSCFTSGLRYREPSSSFILLSQRQPYSLLFMYLQISGLDVLPRRRNKKKTPNLCLDRCGWISRPRSRLVNFKFSTATS